MTRRRRHHNNDGRQQRQSGTARERLRRLANRMGVPFVNDHPELGGNDGQDN